MSKYDLLPPDVNPLEFFFPPDRPAVMPSPFDPRDYPFRPKAAPAGPLPRRAQAKGWGQIPIRYQAQYGSCAAFTGIRMWENANLLAGMAQTDGSEAYIWALIRQSYGELCKNTGLFPRDVMAQLVDRGTLTERQRPYEALGLCDGTTAAEATLALQNPRPLAYSRVEGLQGVKAAIAEGHMVSLCLTLSSNFAPDTNGVIPNPSLGHINPNNGHMITVGLFDDDLYGGVIGVANSWSTGWGRQGIFYMRYSDFNLPESQGGAWKNDLWVLTPPANVNPTPVPPKPLPKTTRTLQQWRYTGASPDPWDIVTLYEDKVALTEDQWLHVVASDEQGQQSHGDFLYLAAAKPKEGEA